MNQYCSQRDQYWLPYVTSTTSKSDQYWLEC